MAADGAKVTAHGADEVQHTLRALADDLRHLDPAAADGAQLVARAAAGFARVRTGRMRGSIRVSAAKFGAQVTAGEGLGVYPAVQEYGSTRRRITPNRYMAQAAETQQDRVVQLVEKDVSRAVDNVKGV